MLEFKGSLSLSLSLRMTMCIVIGNSSFVTTAHQQKVAVVVSVNSYNINEEFNELKVALRNAPITSHFITGCRLYS